MSWKKEFPKSSLEKLAKQQGGPEAVKLHNKGRLTLRERIDLLVDKESFEEIEKLLEELNTMMKEI